MCRAESPSHCADNIYLPAVEEVVRGKFHFSFPKIPACFYILMANPNYKYRKRLQLQRHHFWTLGTWLWIILSGPILHLWRRLSLCMYRSVEYMPLAGNNHNSSQNI